MMGKQNEGFSGNRLSSLQTCRESGQQIMLFLSAYSLHLQMQLPATCWASSDGGIWPPLEGREVRRQEGAHWLATRLAEAAAA